MAEKEVNITYETLFELLRREKSRKDLQKLPDTFFIDVISYLNEKLNLAKTKKDELFDADENLKTEKQIINIRQILKELYERRERKIMEMALNKSRAGHAIIDTSALLDEEEHLFDALLKILNKNRDQIINNLLKGSAPSVELKVKPEPSQAEEFAEELAAQPESPEAVEESTQEQEANTTKLEIKEFVQKFIGLDMKEYGPFEQGDEVELPAEIAQLLIKRGKAAQI